MEKRKVALVTGSSRGIGRGIAISLAKAGYDIAVHHSKSLEDAEKTESELKALGANTCILQGDTGESDVPSRIVKETIEKLGGLDVMVCNAGLTRFESLLDITPEIMDLMYNVNYRGMILCAQAAAKYMVKEKIKGSILFNTSIRSYSQHHGDGVYGGLKAGLNRTIQSFALELGRYGIRVNGFSPGVTVISDRFSLFYKDTPRFIPLRRNGYPEDMGDVVVWLASDASSYVTGQVISVDGGLNTVGAPESYGDLVNLYDIEDWLDVDEENVHKARLIKKTEKEK